MKICFFLTHIPDPRTNKRINFFKQNNDVYVVCARRKNQNLWNPNLTNVTYKLYDIDLPPSRKIVKRFFSSKTLQRRGFCDLCDIKPDIIYTEGLDCLQTVARYRKKHKLKAVFYEVADLRESYLVKPKRLFDRIITRLILRSEKKNFGSIDYLVLTSMKFYEAHYSNLIKFENVVYMPNVPNRLVFETFKKKNKGPFTVGFIGGIRYLEQMKMLVDTAEEIGCDVLFAGAGGTNSEYNEICDYCSNKPYVHFLGKYDYEKDIANIYGMVDCVYAVYDADNPNVRIALPNKLYESVICKLPIIVAKNTYLSSVVEKWGIGYSVDHKNSCELFDCLSKLKNGELKIDFDNVKNDPLDLEYYNKRFLDIIERLL